MFFLLKFKRHSTALIVYSSLFASHAGWHNKLAFTSQFTAVSSSTVTKHREDTFHCRKTCVSTSHLVSVSNRRRTVLKTIRWIWWDNFTSSPWSFLISNMFFITLKPASTMLLIALVICNGKGSTIYLASFKKIRFEKFNDRHDDMLERLTTMKEI